LTNRLHIFFFQISDSIFTRVSLALTSVLFTGISPKMYVQTKHAHAYKAYNNPEMDIIPLEVSIMQRPMILRYTDGEDTPMIDEEFLRVTGVVTYFTKPVGKRPKRRKKRKVIADDIEIYYL
jgi:hypothetical protein